MRTEVNTHSLLAVCGLAFMTMIGRAEGAGPVAEGVRRLQEATPAESISIAEGFRVERLCSAQTGQGSWVAMCFDRGNHLYVSDERSNLLRIALPNPGSAPEAVPAVKVVSTEWGGAQGLLCLEGSLYAVKHGSPDVILRLTDTDSDGVVDHAERFFEFPEPRQEATAWREHGVHAIIASPDGTSLYVVGGDRNPLPCDRGRAPRHWNRDTWTVCSLPCVPGRWRACRARADGCRGPLLAA